MKISDAHFKLLNLNPVSGITKIKTNLLFFSLQTEFPHTNGISVSKRIVQKKLLKTVSPIYVANMKLF